jgi:hypothetical protein
VVRRPRIFFKIPTSLSDTYCLNVPSSFSKASNRWRWSTQPHYISPRLLSTRIRSRADHQGLRWGEGGIGSVTRLKSEPIHALHASRPWSRTCQLASQMSCILHISVCAIRRGSAWKSTTKANSRLLDHLMATRTMINRSLA